MKSKVKWFSPIALPIFRHPQFNLSFFSAFPIETVISNSRSCATAALPVIETYGEKSETVGRREEPLEPADVLRRWGCSANDVSIIFLRRPSLRKMDVNKLQSKLQILSDLGVSSSGLANIIYCRPHFLNCRLNKNLDERIEYLERLFGSREVLL